MKVPLQTLALLAALGLLLGARTAYAARAPAPSGDATASVSSEGEEETNASGSDLSDRVVWTLAAAVAGAVIMGFFYGLKRAVGGFPRSPSWVAPISIERSRDFLSEEDVAQESEADHGDG